MTLEIFDFDQAPRLGMEKNPGLIVVRWEKWSQGLARVGAEPLGHQKEEAEQIWPPPQSPS